MEENSIHKYKIDLSRRKIELLNRPLFSEFRHKNDLAPPIDFTKKKIDILVACSIYKITISKSLHHILSYYIFS